MNNNTNNNTNNNSNNNTNNNSNNNTIKDDINLEITTNLIKFDFILSNSLNENYLIENITNLFIN